MLSKELFTRQILKYLILLQRVIALSSTCNTNINLVKHSNIVYFFNIRSDGIVQLHYMLS